MALDMELNQEIEQVKIGIGLEGHEEIIKRLNGLIADEHLLYIKTRNYHWNVIGPQFSSLHALFEKQYEELASLIDDVAERVRMLGGVAMGTMTQFLEETRLQEDLPEHWLDARNMVAWLKNDHESLANSLRQDILLSDQYGDVGTADLLTAVLRWHEKTAWMLRAILTGTAV